MLQHRVCFKEFQALSKVARTASQALANLLQQAQREWYQEGQQYTHAMLDCPYKAEPLLQGLIFAT
jgi:uncharacterized protein YukE